MSDIYDDPELTPQDGDFDNVVFKEIGDRVKARIEKIERIDTRYGKVAKYWLYDLDARKKRSMLAGAQDLWSQLYKLRPGVGDVIEVELVDIDGRRMIFSVEVVPDPDNEPF